MTIQKIFDAMGIATGIIEDGEFEVVSPIDGEQIGSINLNTTADIGAVISQSVAAFHEWKLIPAPKRGELVRVYGNTLRRHKEALGKTG